KFLRNWYEVNNNKIGFEIENSARAKQTSYKWFPYNKGGSFRKWYGNLEKLVNWENDGYEIKNFKDKNEKLKSRPQNLDYIFSEGITWSFISSAYFGVRYTPKGFLFDVAGSSLFPDQDLKIYLRYLFSKVST